MGLAMARNDRRTADDGRKLTAMIRDDLALRGLRVRGPIAGSEPGEFCLEAEAIDGLYVSIKTTAGPWRNDGSGGQRHE